ncbi:hypothetical protein M422DRAFT_276264 [Sphaerobolus stellatus SS14]|uniref:Unplaced genomic scaffold SPHSTscaffold_684, whole genome shotgun sequence n=1 Tax=Sphaerobolus stellatus (strain SS14) TaxID=990650 RepID=A0A0C9UCK6_SPHS4|nr:hypothetical protein M422DRAFT_276264 [Sphaerobolus stellatus SS14]
MLQLSRYEIAQCRTHEEPRVNHRLTHETLTKKPRVSGVVGVRRATLAGRGRRVGKLCAFIDVPLDVLLEIVSHLSPQDLLNLSRASRLFYKLFVEDARYARAAWRAARTSIPGLPDCPSDLTEPQYAKLVFESDCYECSVSKALKAEPLLRIRLCKRCRIIHIVKGDDLLQIVPGLTEQLLECIHPQAYTNFVSEPNDRNVKKEFFYRRAAEAVVRRYRSEVPDYLRGESLDSAKAAFFENQKRKRTDIFNHAESLSEWITTLKEMKAAEINALYKARKEEIHSRLKDLGFSEDDFPRWYHRRSIMWRDWHKLIHQPKKLTERIWSNIRPTLEQLITDARTIRLQEEQEAKEAQERRLEARRTEAERFAGDLLNARLGRDYPLKICRLDVTSLSLITALWQTRDDYYKPISEGEWQNIAPLIETQLDVFSANIMEQLIRSVIAPRYSDIPRLSDMIQANRWKNVDNRFLGLRSTYFLCVNCGARALHASKNLLCHRHQALSCNTGTFVFDPLFTAVAEVLTASLRGQEPLTFKTGHMPYDEYKYVCLTCDDMPEPMTWLETLAHFRPLGIEDPAYGDKLESSRQAKHTIQINPRTPGQYIRFA